MSNSKSQEPNQEQTNTRAGAPASMLFFYELSMGDETACGQGTPLLLILN